MVWLSLARMELNIEDILSVLLFDVHVRRERGGMG